VEPALIAHPVLVDLRVRARLQALDLVVITVSSMLQPRLHDAQTLSVLREPDPRLYMKFLSMSAPAGQDVDDVQRERIVDRQAGKTSTTERSPG